MNHNILIGLDGIYIPFGALRIKPQAGVSLAICSNFLKLEIAITF